MFELPFIGVVNLDGIPGAISALIAAILAAVNAFIRTIVPGLNISF